MRGRSATGRSRRAASAALALGVLAAFASPTALAAASAPARSRAERSPAVDLPIDGVPLDGVPLADVPLADVPVDGVAVDRAGRPVPGARLVLAGRAERVLATSGPDGALRGRMPAGFGALEVRAEGRATVRHELRARPEGALHLGRVELGPGGTLVATVLDQDGRPYEHAWARWMPEADAVGDELVTGIVDGALVLDGARPGRGLLRVDACASPGRAYAEAVVPAGGAARLDVRLRRLGACERDEPRGWPRVETTVRGRLRGVVAHAGAPVPGARVGVGRWDAAAACARDPHAWTETDGRGAFTLAPERRGPWGVVVEAPGLARGHAGPFAPGDAAAVELARPGAVEGRVVAEGRDVRGLVVAATDGRGVAHTGVVEADGRYRIDGLAPGAWTVRPCAGPVSAVERRALGRRVAPDAPSAEARVASDELARADLALGDEDAYVLDGRLAIEGLDVAGWYAVLSERWEAGWRGSRELRRTRLGADGTFTLATSRGGRLELWLETGYDVPGHHTTVYDAVELRRGRTTWVLDLPTGAVAGAPDERFHAARWRGPGALSVVRWSQGAPDPLPSVPAGPVELVATDERRLEKPGTRDDAAWTVLAELVVPAGGTVRAPAAVR